ncbi:mannan-binding lectin [Aliikangiella sp. G2MR2-5]|uniref:mannan-binding lectin n=1 Tax=Aliikangiella sp. G2MR2-5 TaxID=2788943 RepID=UPI001AED555B|nr:mannan-binding lectin [Aliikangiella sp. G2MR2-5]
MTFNLFFRLSALIILLGLTSFSINAKSYKSKAYDCKADPGWFNGSVTMPVEVKKSNPDGTSDFCDFYQFSWQAFLYLMSTDPTDSSQRNFQNENNYPILEFNTDGTPANSCDTKPAAQRFRVSLQKSTTIPESINQAGDGATIYDQNGNVVYYDVRFSRNMCDVSSINQLTNFPTGTTEIKTAWRVITSAEASNYINMTANVGTQKDVLLGLVGMHLAIATTDHPEFVWATYEHNNNSPDCAKPGQSTGWLFASPQCTDALIKGDSLAIVQCQFNQADKQSASQITGTPTEICREYPYGTAASDPNAEENLGDVTSLNQHVRDNLKGDLAVLKNYFNVGDLWVSNIALSSDISNQRGSLRLANTVAETTFQDVDIHSKNFISNCFGCHNYTGESQNKNKNTTSGSLSHIFDDIAAGLNQCLDVQAGPIMSNSDAQTKCPSTCKNASSALGKWNGQWRTTVPGRMSVCGCCAP